MPPRYTEITLQEMKTKLEAQGFEYYNDPYATEYVFQKYVDRAGNKYTLKLYTSISKYTDDSRDVGSDAIRLVVIGNGKMFGEGRVNRTQHWKYNMSKRINTWDTLFKVCPQCGNALKERKGKFGDFYGCSTFPKCGYTEKKV
jgi:topoisomerase-like DNA binding C4 zinc finger protein